MPINQWGNSGNQAFALPMESATPPLPSLQQSTLAWNPVTQLLAWVPVDIGAITGTISPLGDLSLPAGKNVRVNGLPVVGARNTGWAADTGTALKTSFNTSTVTLEQLAGQVMALKQALVAHGLTGV